MRAVVEDPADRGRGRRISRRVPARRAGVAGMESAGSKCVVHRRPCENRDPYPQVSEIKKEDDPESFKQQTARRRDERYCAHAGGPGFRRDDAVVCGEHPMNSHLRAGILAATLTLIIDQASKLWLLFVFDIAHRGAVKVTPFFHLVLAWNVGISFGWFQNDGFPAQIVLTAIKAVAVIVLAIWMARSRHRLA